MYVFYVQIMQYSAGEHAWKCWLTGALPLKYRHFDRAMAVTSLIPTFLSKSSPATICIQL